MSAWHTNDAWSTSKPSLSHLNPEPTLRQVSGDKSSRIRVPSTSATYSTPHDAFLSDLQGPPTSGTRPVQEGLGPEPGPSSDVESMLTREDNKLRSRSDLNLLTPTPSLHGGTARPGIHEFLHDPFDGNILGVLAPVTTNTAEDALRHEGPSSHSQINLSAGSPLDDTLPGAGTSGVASPTGPTQAGGGGEAVWSHLTKILDLQAQISKMHIEMEAIGSAKATEAKKPRMTHKGATPMTATFPSEQPLFPPGLGGRRKRTVSGVTIGSLDDEQEGDEGRHVGEEAEKNRAREEEFAKLASQFEGRKEAIHDIMSSLDDLSKALSEFHALQPPQMELQGSRQNSIGYPAAPSTLSPFGTDLDNKRVMQGSAPPPSRPQYDWSTQHQAPSSQLTVPLTRARSDSATTTAPAVRPASQKKVVPGLVISPVDNPKGITDSPASTIGSLKLPPEE